MVPVGVVLLLCAAARRTGDHGHGARGEVVAMVVHTVDLGMKLETVVSACRWGLRPFLRPGHMLRKSLWALERYFRFSKK